MNILVTGGAGYIGSHAALRLIEDGHEVTVVDDLSRGNPGALDVLRSAGLVRFEQSDVGNAAAVESIMRRDGIDTVMHFAALTSVGESMQHPLRYFRANAGGGLALLEAVAACGAARVIFSSTAATYGEPPPEHVPIAETCPQHPINPYGASKLMVERMMFDAAAALRREGRDFACAALRYFNVAGSDSRGRLGEDHDPETHLVPICLEAALGQRTSVTVFGADYPTPDGTCIRDYVHVQDLVDAHVRVMHALRAGDTRVYNIGIGRGRSVREVIASCRRVTGEKFAVVDGERREGDPPALYADASKLARELGWSAAHTDLDDIVRSAWEWRKAHPRGYRMG